MSCLCACRLIVGAEGAEIHVDAAVCPAVGTGTVADPFCSIQDGVDAAAPGDLVRVASGRYAGISLRSIDIDGFLDTMAAVLFLKDGVSVIGAGPGDSVLDAGGRATAVIADRTGAGTLLQGFTLTGAGTGSGAGFDFADGLFVNGGAPRIADLEITRTEGGFAAADIYAGATPRLDRLRVHDNGLDAAVGAAVLVSGGARPSLASILVADNHGAAGGGVVVEDAGLSLVNAIVAGNDGVSGGGVRLARATATDISFTTIAGNTSGIAGAGVDFEGSTATLRGVLVIGNRSLSGQVGGVFADSSSLPGLECNNVFGNLDADYQSRFNPTGTNGNISQDPMFLDFGAMDFRLGAGSPAIDRGLALAESAAAEGVAAAADFSGASRPLDGDRDGVARSDIGALEFDRFEVRGLTLASLSLLEWTGLQGATGYLLHRGTLADLRSGGYGACMTPGGDLTEARFGDPDLPPAGTGFFYLATARVGGAEQTLGFDWLGLERAGRPGDACP